MRAGPTERAVLELGCKVCWECEVQRVVWGQRLPLGVVSRPKKPPSRVAHPTDPFLFGPDSEFLSHHKSPGTRARQIRSTQMCPVLQQGRLCWISGRSLEHWSKRSIRSWPPDLVALDLPSSVGRSVGRSVRSKIFSERTKRMEAWNSRTTLLRALGR